MQLDQSTSAWLPACKGELTARYLPEDANSSVAGQGCDTAEFPNAQRQQQQKQGVCRFGRYSCGRTLDAHARSGTTEGLMQTKDHSVYCCDIN